MMEQHGIWHNLYIGLGAVENPFGIEWRDGNAIDTVKKIDPSLRWGSNRYFHILRDLYFDILWQNPIEVVKVYLKKLYITLTTVAPGWPQFWNIRTILLLIGLSAALARIGSLATIPPWHPADAVLAVSVIFIGAFLGQATLFHFDMQYTSPIQVFFLLCVGAIAEFLARCQGLAPAPQKLAKPEQPTLP
jgi:hypothetical protein